MLGGVERIVERPAALWTRLNGHAQSQRIVGDGRAPGQYRLNNRAERRLGMPTLKVAIREWRCAEHPAMCGGPREGGGGSVRGGRLPRCGPTPKAGRPPEVPGGGVSW